MNYYTVQVKTRCELQFIDYIKKNKNISNNQDFNLYFLQRKIKIRKNKIVRDTILPIFPGYVFIEIESLSHEIYRSIRTTPGFYRYLPTTLDPKPLINKDLAIIKHFLSFGALAEKSTVQFNENNRIVVLEGPLKGLEGMIIKVDKRKGRAKVKLDMYEDSFLIDLAFETLGVQ